MSKAKRRSPTKRSGKKHGTLEAALGHAIPAESAEWLDVDVPQKGSAEDALEKHAALLLVGIAPFGEDASGNRVWASLRPHPLDVSEVFVLDHDTGALEKMAESLADFVALGKPRGARDDDAKARAAFAARAKKALEKRPQHLGPESLFTRSRWLLGLLTHEKARLAEQLADAPDLPAWKKEKASLPKEPQLALYWMLAHLLMGNDEACREAVRLSKKSKGHVVVELAKAFEGFFAGKRETPIDVWSRKDLDAIRALVAKSRERDEDGPDALAALVVALETHAPNDPRLAHVVAALVKRNEAAAREAVRAAAWRWLDGAATATLKKRQRRSAPDDVLPRDDGLRAAAHAILAPCDDEAEKLAIAISDKGLSFRVLKTTVGRVFRVYGRRGLVDRAPRMESLLSLLDEVPGEPDPEEPGVRLDTTASVAMAEASLALARLAPERARKVFVEALARPRRTAMRQAAVAACLLPGIFELDPASVEGLHWLERVLGARSGPPWLYGALVGAQGFPDHPDVAQWVLPHAYTSQLDATHAGLAHLEEVARETLDILGSPAPPFEEAKGADASSIGVWLEDFFRFSRYEPESELTRGEARAAINLLRSAGDFGRRELARLGKLPEIGDWAKEMLGA